MQGSPATMQAAPHYDDVVTEVFGFVLDRAAAARAGGVDEVWVDPGIGFGKTMAHNLSPSPPSSRAGGGAAEAAGCAGVLVGTSRKRFLGLLAAPVRGGGAGGVEERVEGSLATAALAMVAGVRMVRVHDVAVTVQAARLYGPAA